MYADNLRIGQKFINKQTKDMCVVIEIEDGCKVFVSDYGVWNYLDESLFEEIF